MFFKYDKCFFKNSQDHLFNYKKLLLHQENNTDIFHKKSILFIPQV